MASNSGVTKSSATKGNKTHLPEMVERDEEGLLPPGFMERVAAQAKVSEGRHPTDNSSDTHDGGQLDGSGPIDQDNSSPPSNSSVVKSIERDDSPMDDAGSVDQTGAGSSSSGHERPPAAGHSQNQYDFPPSARGTTEPEEPELLATLDFSNDEEENDALVDGWGTLRTSTFVILQYGPRHGARYKFKYRHGYTNASMNSISESSLRISQIKVSPGSKAWRYTKHNVVGIYGIASEERKNPNKKYKSDPCTWLKIKWKDLRSEDTDKMQHSCSWIPRSDFLRFCNGKRAADAKIKEVWDKQEERYQRVLRSDTGRRTEYRSPTPFPLGSAARQSPERQASSRLSTPARQISFPGQHESPPSANRPMHSGGDSLSNPINLDQNENPRTPTSSGATAKSNVNAMQAGPQPSAGGSAILNEEQFMAEKAEEECWNDMDDHTRQTQEAIAKAMYHVYLDAIAKARRAQDPVVGSIVPGAGTAVAAH
ncbi:hypothetical protein NUH16_003093 [Penicillium rubens]|nr:hypothetical protein NUH16_003093 [Penicillium rubens]